MLWSAGRRIRESIVERPSAVLAQLCAAFLFLSAASPFDLTFAPNLVYRSVCESHLVPFTNDARLSSTITSTQTDVDGRTESRRRNDRWQRSLDHASTAAGYGLLAILICYYLKNHCKVVGQQRTAWCLQACGLLALFSSGAQLFVLSRSLDTTDILMALVGASLGIMVADRCAMLWVRAFDEGQSADRMTLLRVGCAVMLVMVVARELAPFHFATDTAHVRAQLGDVELLPFKSYQTARLPIAVEDILAKLGRLAFFGAALAAWRSGGRFTRDMGSIKRAAIGIGALVAALEVIQIFLPARTPAMTDVLLAVVGASAGVALLRMAVVVSVMAREFAYSTFDQPIFNVTFDEDEAAPKERVPSPDEFGVPPLH